MPPATLCLYRSLFWIHFHSLQVDEIKAPECLEIAVVLVILASIFAILGILSQDVQSSSGGGQRRLL